MYVLKYFQVAIPNLFYGKTLIELAQMGENKIIALPDHEEDEGEDDETEAEGDAGAEDGTKNEAKTESNPDEEAESDAEEVASKVDKTAENNKAGSSHADVMSSSLIEPQPSTSSGIRNGNNVENDNGDGDANENLQFAWEALEMAAKIFRRLGVGYEEYLAEAHYGLGEILMENQNCAEAIHDYSKF